jgi:short-subunit dehydrogenase
MVARERGTIVNIGSIAAIEPMKTHGVYAASKHALRGWSLSTYERLREHGLKTVLGNPAFVDTPMTAAHAPGVRARPVVRPFADPDKLADVVPDFATGTPVTIAAGREVPITIQWSKP